MVGAFPSRKSIRSGAVGSSQMGRQRKGPGRLWPAPAPVPIEVIRMLQAEDQSPSPPPEGSEGLWSLLAEWG
jgi:hypothetical protein